MRDNVIWILVVAILTNFAYIQGLQEKLCKAEQDCFGVDNVRHTYGYFFFENLIMAEIVQPSDKIKLILHYFNNEPV